MRYLLDTHAFLFWMLDSPDLPDGVRAIMGEHPEQIAFSVLSAREIAIKTAIGKLSGVPLPTLSHDIEAQGFRVLELSLRHVQTLATLPRYHNDLFDRGLAATARCDDLTLITRDPVFAQYGVRTYWQ